MRQKATSCRVTAFRPTLIFISRNSFIIKPLRVIINQLTQCIDIIDLISIKTFTFHEVKKTFNWCIVMENGPDGWKTKEVSPIRANWTQRQKIQKSGFTFLNERNVKPDF